MALEWLFSYSRTEMPEESIKSPPEATEMLEYTAFHESTEAAETPITFSEGGFDIFGGYHPGRVSEINEETAEAPKEIEQLSESLETWIHQSEPMSCAVACQTMVYNQLSKEDVSEKAMIDRGRELGLYDNGTLSRNEGKILESLGFDVERRTDGSLTDLESACEGGQKVIAHIDSLKLAYPHSAGPCTPDHAVQVLRIENTENGEMVVINDPGQEGGSGLAYPIEIFSKAFNGDMTSITKGCAKA